MQRIRRQFTLRQLGRSQPLLRLRPPPPPQRITTQPIRSRGPSPRRQGSVISNRFQRLLPVHPRLDHRRPPHRRQPIRQFLQRLPRNPRKLSRPSPRPPQAEPPTGKRRPQRRGRAHGLERRSPDRHARRSAPRTACPHPTSRRPPPRTPPRAHGPPGLERRLQPAQPAPGGRSRVWPPAQIARTQQPPTPRLARQRPGLERSGLRDGAPPGTAGLQTGTRATGPQSASPCSPDSPTGLERRLQPAQPASGGRSRVWLLGQIARPQKPPPSRLAEWHRWLGTPVSRPARAALRAAHVVTPLGNRRLQPRRKADQGRRRPRLGAPASGRHRARARNPP